MICRQPDQLMSKQKVGARRSKEGEVEDAPRTEPWDCSFIADVLGADVYRSEK